MTSLEWNIASLPPAPPLSNIPPLSLRNHHSRITMKSWSYVVFQFRHQRWFAPSFRAWSGEAEFHNLNSRDCPQDLAETPNAPTWIPGRTWSSLKPLNMSLRTGFARQIAAEIFWMLHSRWISELNNIERESALQYPNILSAIGAAYTQDPEQTSRSHSQPMTLNLDGYCDGLTSRMFSPAY